MPRSSFISSSGRRTFSLARLGVLLALAALPGPEVGAQGKASEIAVKAAFVYHFTQFVEWPDDAFPSSGSPIVIGVYGSPAMARALEETVQGKSANGRRLVVKPFAANPSGERLQLLFVGNGVDFRAAAYSTFKDKPVLVVGESPGFARRGGHLNLLIEEGRVAFELNMAAAKASRLAVSSKLVRLAKAVIS